MLSALRRLSCCSSCQVRQSIFKDNPISHNSNTASSRVTVFLIVGALVALTHKAFFFVHFFFFYLRILARSLPQCIYYNMNDQITLFTVAQRTVASQREGPDFEPRPIWWFSVWKPARSNPGGCCFVTQVSVAGIIPCCPERNHMASWQMLVSGA